MKVKKKSKSIKQNKARHRRKMKLFEQFSVLLILVIMAVFGTAILPRVEGKALGGAEFEPVTYIPPDE